MGKGTSSLWRETASNAPRETFRGDLTVQVAVIGAGLAGILIADRLQARGMDVVVLEADRIGSGQTKNTTAKITSQHGMIYDALIQTFGEQKAKQYAQANERALGEYERLIRQRRIECAYRKAPAYLYSQTSEEPLRREAQAAASLGIAASFQKDTELPFPVAGAVRFDHQACFHPLRFLRAVSKGVTVYEHSKVLSVEGDELRLSEGRIRAEHIVFATHFPFINLPGCYFMRMHQERSYILALDNPWKPEGLYFGVDNDGVSLREAEGKLLMAGGNHRTGENSLGGRYEALLEQAHAWFPQAREAARWSAQDCITLDGVPYIGRFSPSTPRWYVATGFAKWGISTAMVSAMLLDAQIAGETPEWADVFDPARFQMSASAKNLVVDTVQAFKGLSRQIFALPRATLDALPVGHGGIVEADGQKAGVYKDEKGQCHVINPRCPHLGCQLEWNPDEKSWDCPCHGSRFHYDGTLIDNPAQDGVSCEGNQ